MDADEPKSGSNAPHRPIQLGRGSNQEKPMVTTAPNRERKTAIIIGASRGLGLGLAREFARRGWQVTATARNASSAKELAATFAALDEKIAVEQVDIDLPDRIAALASRLALCR